MTGIHRACAFGVLLLLSTVGLGSAAAGQPDNELDRSMIGRQVARAGIIDLRLQPDAGPDDASITADLLQIATQLRPDDPIVLRLLIEARRAAGDDAGVMQATRSLLRLDPDDEIALLRLIAWQISQRQTVEQRLAGYEFWLDGAGASELADKPAVLSRLALDAALLHRELGEERAFVERLDQAATLDSTNKEAATLVATYFAERSNDPIGRLELAINVLLADPVDPNLHLAIATQLARLEAFGQASRFHANGRALAAKLGEAETPSIVTEAVALNWHTMGPAAVLNAFESMLNRARRDSAEAIRQRRELGESVDDILAPDEIRLTLERERFRLFAALAVGDRVLAERSIRDLDATINPMIEEIGERLRQLDRNREADRVALISRAVQLTTEAATARLISGIQVDRAVATLDELEQAQGARLGDQLAVLRAFATLRTESPDAAMLAFEPHAERTVLGAVGGAMAAEAAGDRERAEALYERAARFSPLTAVGVFARSGAERLNGGPLTLPATAEQAGAVAAAVPGWVDTASRQTRSLIRLDARVEEASIDAFDEARIRIEVRNMLPRPIGVGGDRPVATRFALAPDIAAGAFPLASDLTPEVVELQRKLRLDPGESLVGSVWPDAGQAGWIAEVKGAHRIRARWNVLQGFVAGQGIPFSTGPLSLSSETGLLVRRPNDDVLLDAAQLIRNADGASEARLLSLLPAYRSALIDVDRPGGPIGDTDASALARSLAGRYPQLPLELRIAVASIIPPSAIRPSLRPLDEALLAETDPTVLKLVLISRVVDPADPVLARCISSPDEGLSSFARRLSTRLEAGVRSGYAFLSPPAAHIPKPETAPGSGTGGAGTR